ncbi:DUF4926 domain-containing protein [Nitrosococcus watsonii]|uniref:DUF4926 domain-containing protein n=1 Tax=Nitrosococcus watsoni (strain C-113) TaxID=105559 RepID=D8K992_NITWC|nr:DUF4926 domain-containing protein [Nitrosococcus watsonii]ADJ29235.1 conserved hypothetical protein [Nitrosococcus watsonii C-113]
MIRELELVVLTQDVPEHGLKAGDLGTVVLIHEAGTGYEVEFATLSGETLAVLTLPADSLRPAATREIAHVREVA